MLWKVYFVLIVVGASRSDDALDFNFEALHDVMVDVVGIYKYGVGAIVLQGHEVQVDHFEFLRLEFDLRHLWHHDLFVWGGELVDRRHVKLVHEFELPGAHVLHLHKYFVCLSDVRLVRIYYQQPAMHQLVRVHI